MRQKHFINTWLFSSFNGFEGLQTVETVFRLPAARFTGLSAGVNETLPA
jgi:hypothetical protein